MNYKLSQKSLDKLKGVHPDLYKVVVRAIELTTVDFSVGETLRTLARQKELVAKGASKTINSRHLTGHAVDLYALKDGKVSWDLLLYKEIAKAMKQAAKELDIALVAGIEWKMVDGPHFELDWKAYPK